MNAADLAKMTPEEKEAYHRSKEAKVETFSYRRPDSSKEKDVIRLGRSELSGMNMQVLREGGENNLHYHNNSDTIWYVLRGGAKFYGPGDVLIADLGPDDGIVMPGGARYWFEKTGTEDLELMQFVAREPTGGSSERINVEKHKAWMTDSYLQVYEKTTA